MTTIGFCNYLMQAKGLWSSSTFESSGLSSATEMSTSPMCQLLLNLRGDVRYAARAQRENAWLNSHPLGGWSAGIYLLWLLILLLASSFSLHLEWEHSWVWMSFPHAAREVGNRDRDSQGEWLGVVLFFNFTCFTLFKKIFFSFDC